MILKEAIKRKGWTTTRLAEAMGISQPSVSQIINGNPTISKVKEVAEAMGCNWLELLSEQAVTPTITCPHCGKTIQINITTKD